MHYKIVAFVGAALATLTTFSATAADVPTTPPISIEQAVQVCRVSTQQLLKGDKGKALKEALDIIPDKKYKASLAFICVAYLSGFDDGLKYEGNQT